MRVSTLAFTAALLLASAAAAQAPLLGKTEGAKPGLIRTLDGPAGVTVHPALARLGGAIFSDGFEGNADGTTPTGWVVENTNGDDMAWTAQAQRAHSGTFAAIVFWNATAPADDWLISPGFSLAAGTEYRISFWFKPGDAGFGTAESMEVSIGGEQSSAGMTDPLVDLNNVAAGDYREVTALYTPSAGGTFYLGFHCDSATDQYFCAVDDVLVDVAPTGPVISVAPTSIDFGNTLNNTTAAERVTISNTGGADLTIDAISLIGTGFGFDLTGTSTTIAAGGSTTFDVLFSPTSNGDYAGSVSIASDDPASPTTIDLTGSGVTPPANDARADAIAISGAGPFTGTNLFATVEGSEPAPTCNPDEQGASVWWAYTASRSGSLTLDFSTSSFDTVVTLHEADGTEIACDDDGGTVPFTSRILGAPITNGTTYLIRVAGYGAEAPEQGDISFTAVEGDAFVTTTASGAIGATPTFNRPQADGDGTAGSCEADDAGFAYDSTPLVVDAAGVYQITAEWGDPLDGYLLLYEGAFDPASPCVGLIGRNDDQFFFDGSSSAIETDLVAGTRYTLVFTTFGVGDSGTYALTIFGQGAASFATAEEGAPTAASVLGAPRPNPTAGDVRFTVTLASAETVRLSVHDVLGREVAVLHAGALAAGETAVSASTAGLPAGRYVVRAVGETFQQTRALTVVR